MEGLKVKQGYTADMKWTVNERQNCYEVLADGFITLAKTKSKTAEDKANAHLIASAPELLEALKWISKAAIGNPPSDAILGAIHGEATKAIAKAEVRS